MDNRDRIRLTEELLESHRRKQVREGKWKEGESKKKLIEEIQELKAKQLSPKDEQQMRKELPDLLNLLKSMGNPEQLLEQEYHFDEGLGQSLTEHTESLKQNFPGM